MVTGCCQCEGVKWEADELNHAGVKCYCTICRKVSGGPFAALVGTKGFKVVAGSDLLVKYNATPVWDRMHCGRCHSPIFGSLNTVPGFQPYVYVGTLDDQALLNGLVFNHMFTRSKVPWHPIQEAGAQFETYPPM